MRIPQQVCLLILGGVPFIPSISIPLVPNKHDFKVTVPNWLSLSVSPISRFSGRLQFGPHAEVASEAAWSHSLFTDIYEEVATT